jgi:hypothetical protein
MVRWVFKLVLMFAMSMLMVRSKWEQQRLEPIEYLETANMFCSDGADGCLGVYRDQQALFGEHGRRLGKASGATAAKGTKKSAPPLTMQKCKDANEAYSASYLISREHIMYQNTGYNLTWVNCEMGSFIMMYRKGPENGTLLQSVDVLDFSVIHLSAYER